MVEIYYWCCDLTRIFGNLFGWNYYETKTYLFLVGQPAIYALLGWLTVVLNGYTIIKYKPDIVPISLLASATIISDVIAIAYSINMYHHLLPALYDPVQAFKEEIANNMETARLEEDSIMAYMRIIFFEYVLFFIVALETLTICNLPHIIYIYRKRKKRKAMLNDKSKESSNP